MFIPSHEKSREEALIKLSDKELIAHLAACLSHTLRFSSINYKWPEQKEATLTLIRVARERTKELVAKI